MPAEIEAKFLNVGHAALREKLSAAGFTCTQPDTLMRRVVFDLPGGDMHNWARVRDEAGVITVSYKRVNDGTRIGGTDEIQIIADDFDRACDLLSAFGLIRKSYQETRREIWTRGGIEVALDTWPVLAPFIELEAADENTVKAAAAELGFHWEDAIFCPVGGVFERCGFSAELINGLPRLTFENSAEIAAKARKNNA